MQKTLV